mmetsp:Transcript_7518/g.14713  ORF Transcript_7518/g.14713 Transcript_7518/m.14713 type:complete len:381 (+) Transcript_7518:114-1256(+)
MIKGKKSIAEHELSVRIIRLIPVSFASHIDTILLHLIPKVSHESATKRKRQPIPIALGVIQSLFEHGQKLGVVRHTLFASPTLSHNTRRNIVRQPVAKRPIRTSHEREPAGLGLDPRSVKPVAPLIIAKQMPVNPLGVHTSMHAPRHHPQPSPHTTVPCRPCRARRFTARPHRGVLLLLLLVLLRCCRCCWKSRAVEDPRAQALSPRECNRHFVKICNESVAVISAHALGVKLHAPEGEGAVSDCHDNAIVGPGELQHAVREVGGRSILVTDTQRVITCCQEAFLRNVCKQVMRPSVPHNLHLTVHRPVRRVRDREAVSKSHCLVAKADSQSRDRTVSNDLAAQTDVFIALGTAGPGREDHTEHAGGGGKGLFVTLLVGI